MAKELIDEIKFLIKESKKYSSNKTFKTHYGEMTLLELYSYCLIHLMIHGNAIARTLTKPLPVTNESAALALPSMKLIMPKLFDKNRAKGFTANFVIDIRGVEKFAIICDKGKLKIENKLPKKIDCRISATPLAFFLISTGNTSKWKQILTGKFFVFGKKPWLAFQLQTLFISL